MIKLKLFLILLTPLAVLSFAYPVTLAPLIGLMIISAI
jgi:hypothetical protein